MSCGVCPDSQPPTFLPPHHQREGVRVEVSVHMKSRGAGFGFQVSGGVDTGQPAQVDMVLPGRSGGGAGGGGGQDPGGGEIIICSS